jgi:TonB family protein
VKHAITAAPKPVYPEQARRDRHVGKGLFGLIVDQSTGKVRIVHVLISTGHQILDDAARQALSGWRFTPGSVDKTTVPMIFTLSGNGEPGNVDIARIGWAD